MGRKPIGKVKVPGKVQELIEKYAKYANVCKCVQKYQEHTFKYWKVQEEY